MRVPNSRRDRTIRSDQAMTPMIDVVFLLLIFFVCASLGHRPESLLGIDLSRGSTETVDLNPPAEPDPTVTELWLTLYPSPSGDGTFVELNQREFQDLAELEAALESLGEIAADSPVILDVGGDIVAEDWVRVDDACRAAGFESIQYAADRSKIPPKSVVPE
ncbi:ExbD/TolR family protein [Thalassoroseus pseudoceratinae]|uniref:ExbD/TolR family protein n=1 Tax=Thalassoroseus pseudoceratinae TaxID=2713176 RepID=UPI00141DEAE5|nr:biopolymer transporter ExbD [Thalassoroseus pseudoceratinae]